MKFKLTRVAKAVLVSGLALAPVAAYADPVSLIAWAAGYYLQSKMAFVAVMLIGKIYGSMDARRKARHAAEDARRSINSSLTDRSVSALTNAPPWRIRYGRSVAGGDVVHILTSDKPGIRLDGTTYTKFDAYKHLVVELAHHEVEAIHDTFIDGVPVGPLDGNGHPTGGAFLKTQSVSAFQTIGGSGQIVVGVPVLSIVNAYVITGVSSEYYVPEDVSGSITLSSGNTIINGPVGAQVNYTVDASIRSIRIQKHLGADAQTVDAFLNGLFPTEWDSTHRLRGSAYVVITLDLEDVRFQGGIPNMTFDVSGKKCFDPRTGLTVYTENVAICMRDWLLSDWGYGVDATDIDDASVIAAANACDVRASATVQAYSDTFTANATTDEITFTNERQYGTGDGIRFTTTTTLPAPLAAATTYYIIEGIDRKSFKLATTLANARAGTAINITSAGTGTHTGTWWDYDTYTLSAAFSTADSKPGLLDEMADAMAGMASCSGLWVLQAGAWTAPVMDLSEADLDGVISVPHSDTDYGELFNGMRGLYVPKGKANSTEYQNYQNGTFLTADGEPLWEDKNFLFTDKKARVRNLCRIFTERNRSGQVIFFPAKLRAWPLQIGDRVRVTSAEYGLVLKEYQLIDWQFGINSVVGLTLQEDTAGTYDLADATTADPTRNTSLADPWVTTQLSGLAFSSAVVWQADGSFSIKVTVSWTPSTDAYMLNGGGRIVLHWRRPTDAGWRTEETTGDASSISFVGARQGDILTFELIPLNSNKQPGPPTYASYTVPSTVPANSNSDIAFVVHGAANSMQVRGNAIRKFAGSSAWDAGVYSKSPIRGACSVSFVNGGGGSYMIALNADPITNASYETLDFAWYIGAPNPTDGQIYESGALVVTGITIAASGDQFRIRYTGNTIEYWQNGTLIRSKSVPTGLVFYLDSSFFGVGAEAQSVMFTPDTPAPRGNLLDSSSWIVGTSGNQGSSSGAPGQYWPMTGVASENSIVLDAAPDGLVRPLWKTSQADTGNTETGGGWITGLLPIDPAQMYRFSVWMRDDTVNAAGSLFLGVGSGGGGDYNVRDMSGVNQDNAYFVVPTRANMVPGRWYLALGFVFPSSYAGAQLNQGGLWDGVTGQKVEGGVDFKWVSGLVATRHRAFQYYGSVDQAAHLWKPRLEMCDGDEPTIAELLAPALSAKSNVSAPDFEAQYALNGQFTNWLMANALPDGWATNSGTNTRETTITRTGPNAVRSVSDGSGTAGIVRQIDFSAQPLVAGTFIEGTMDVYLDSHTSGGYPGLLVRLYSAASFGGSRDIFFNLPNTTVDGWQTIAFKAAVNAGERIYGVLFGPMSSNANLSGGVGVNNVIFDSLVARAVQPSNTPHIVTNAVSLGEQTVASADSVSWTNAAALFDPRPYGSTANPMNGYIDIVHKTGQKYVLTVNVSSTAFADANTPEYMKATMYAAWRDTSAGNSFGVSCGVFAKTFATATTGRVGALGCTITYAIDPVSNAWVDGHTYRLGAHFHGLGAYSAADALLAPGASALINMTCSTTVQTLKL